MTDADYLNEFDSEIKPSSSIPYCQIQNPPNLSLAQIKQYKAPSGLFLAQDQAELVEFDLNDWFTQIRLVFGEDSDERREVDGWLTHRIRVSIIYRSAGIEILENFGKGWKYLGQAYRNGKLTQAGELANSDKENYRFRTRYLLMFLDENNQPLHKTPLKLGLGRGTGGSLGEEVRSFRSEIEKVFFKLRGEPQKSLSDRAHALTVLDVELGLHKGEGRAPFVTPVRRFAPAIEQVGVEKTVTRRERSVKLIGQPIQSLLIPKSSETGQLIVSFWEECKDFPTMFEDFSSEEDSTSESPFLSPEPSSSPQSTLNPPSQPEVKEENVMDYSEVIARTDALLKQLGWSTERGRQFLTDTYGVKSRQLLNDEQLLNFLRHLEGLAEASSMALDSVPF